MKKMFLVIGIACFFAAFGFGSVNQSFAQQDSRLTGEIEEFTREDNFNLEKAISEENWDLAVFYLEKKQIFLRRLIKKAETMMVTIDDEIIFQGGDPEFDPGMIELRGLLASSKNILENLNNQLREMRELSRIAKAPL